MAKGAGMVRPDMATMLAFLTTDADLDAATLAGSLRAAVDGSFNSLNIDGCESTNDTVIVMASGDSGFRPDPASFASALSAACRHLAIAMAQDAEGASRMVMIDVDGAADDATARYLGRAIADSALVRSSFYGGDANWGRVLGALGATRVDLSIEDVSIAYNGVVVAREGMGVDYDEPALLTDCEEGDLHLTVTVGDGRGSASVITTDLTPDYVIFNGERS
jgi:glutamate N-acetyltransferase/amino-acid N-acetyltransferase